MPIVVKTRRLDSSRETIAASFALDQRDLADNLAKQINCKPFTPFFAWVEEPQVIATGKAYSPVTRDWTEVTTYEARDRMEAIRWVRFNREWMKDLRINGELV